MKFYNSDTFKVSKDKKVLAQMYTRLDTEVITHKRIAFDFMDLIGSLGGVNRIMMQLATYVIGGYAAFHSSLATANALTKIKIA